MVNTNTTRVRVYVKGDRLIIIHPNEQLLSVLEVMAQLPMDTDAIRLLEDTIKELGYEKWQ